MISLLSGHIGGANKLTVQIADIIGGNPIITTATDINNKLSVDEWANSKNMHIADMKKALGDFTSSGINAAEFEKAVEEYVSLLNQHIFKENNVLFQMAENVLSADEDKKLFDNFEKLEVERIGLGKHEEFHALMDTLADKYR